MLPRILDQLRLPTPRSFIKGGFPFLEETLKKTLLYCRATLLFLLGQEHSFNYQVVPTLQLLHTAAHLKDRVTPACQT